MPSSYTSSLRLVLPVTGELVSAWGDVVNNGLTSPVEQAIAGTTSIALADANHTLTVATEAPDEARCMFVTLTGALTAQREVVCPSYSKLYFVTNNTTGGRNIYFKTSAGNGVLVPPGERTALYCDGVDVLAADTLNSVLDQGVEAAVASAATVDIGGQATPFLRITGTTGITSFGTTYKGPRYLRFADALVLTHNAATLLLPTGANVTTAAGDRALLVPIGNPASGWMVAFYQRANGASLAVDVSVATGVLALANGGTGVDTAAEIQALLPVQQARTNVASAGTVDLTTAVPSNDHINITGTTTIAGFMVAAGRLIFVRFDASLTLTNGAGLVTQTGEDIITQGGDTCILRATAADTVEVLSFTSAISYALGFGQTWQNVLASRALATNYTNTTGRPILVQVGVVGAGVVSSMLVDGVTVSAIGSAGGDRATHSAVVPNGSVYRVNNGTLETWAELRS